MDTSYESCTKSQMAEKLAHLPATVASSIIRRNADGARAALAAWPRASQAQQLLTQTGTAEIWAKQVAALAETSSHDILRQLAKDRDCSVRYCVALNPSCPPDALLLLTNDVDPEVREVALTNRALETLTLFTQCAC